MPSEALDELLAEIHRYEGYLGRLEERRAGTPVPLYDRLRGEYESRLADLRVRAEAEAETLAAGLEEDEAAVLAVEDRLLEVEEERAEGELRAAVGELDPRVWAKRLSALSAQIASIGAERDALVAALAHRRALLDEVHAGEEGGGLSPSPQPPRVAFAAPTPSADPTPADDGPSVARFERPSAPAPRATPLPSPPIPPAGLGGREAERMGDGEEGNLFQQLGALAGLGAAGRGPARREEGPRPGSDAKSLRCDECGTLNFPSEWYCERCGGELAAN